MRRRILISIAFSFVLLWVRPSLASQQYLIPVFSPHLVGASGAYDSEILVTNPRDQPVMVTVTAIYPVVSEACVCPGATSLLLHNRETLSLLSQSVFKDGVRLLFGAVLLAADEEITVQSWVAHESDGSSQMQVVPVVREFLPAETFAWIPHAFRGGNGFQTINLFLTNPTDSPIVVRYAIGGVFVPPGTAVIVPGASTVVVPITFIFPVFAPPRSGYPMTLESSGPFYAITSDGAAIRQPVVLQSLGAVKH